MVITVTELKEQSNICYKHNSKHGCHVPGPGLSAFYVSHLFIISLKKGRLAPFKDEETEA